MGDVNSELIETLRFVEKALLNAEYGEKFEPGCTCALCKCVDMIRLVLNKVDQ